VDRGFTQRILRTGLLVTALALGVVGLTFFVTILYIG
jgi:hypothetical protein